MKTDLKIKYYHQGLWPGRSPASTFVTFNALGFLKNNIDFELVICRNNWKSRKQILVDVYGINENLPIRRIGFSLLDNLHFVTHCLAFFYFLFVDIDVLITRNLGFLPYAFFLRKIKNIRVVLESHDFYSNLEQFHESHYSKNRKKYVQEKKYLPKLDDVICVSEVQKKYYQSVYPKQNFLTAITGVKTHHHHTPKKEFQYQIAYIGTLNPRDYDIHFLIDVIEKVANPEVRLLLIGAKNENEIQHIREYIDKKKQSKRVQILPWMDPLKLESIKGKIDIGLCPMRICARSHMCSPLKVLEYLSAGIPVIASEVEGVKQIIQNNINGFTVPLKEEHWIDTINAMYQDIQKFKVLSGNCLQSAEKFSWENRANHIYQYLNC